MQSFTSIDLLPFTSKDSIDWESFKTWLENRHRKKTVVDRFNHASQFSECLIQQNFLKLNLASDSKRQHALKGLAALSRFLGIHNVFTALVKNNGIKWSGKRSEDLIIERLTRTVNGNEISEWVKSIKLAIPELSTFLDFTAATGLRYEESVNAWNLIIDLSAKGKLTEYYNSANQVLEHFRFKELFIRNSKKVFISYVSEDLVKRVAQSKKFTVDSIQCKIKRQKMRLKFGDLREYYASIMVRHLSQAEIDFVQGRISTSIFMRNYFNPAWLTDLKLRALRGSEQILTQIS